MAPSPAPASHQQVTLTAAVAKQRLRPEPATEAEIFAYNGTAPGPAIRARRGHPLSIRLENQLSQPTSLHFSGYRVPNAVDGVGGLTQPPVAPGAGVDIAFTPQDAGTYIYHPLVPGRTAEQVERGLAGLFVVEEDDWERVDADYGLMLDDWRLTDQHQIDPNFAVAGDNARLGRLGNTLTVNGRPAPETFKAPPNARVRLRVCGLANARIMPMRFEKMARATVIAIDGQPCEPFDPLRRQVIVAPGSRYDIVLDLPGTAGAEIVVLVALGDGLPVMRFETEGEALPAKPPVRPLPLNPGLPEAIRLQDARRAEFTIAGGWDAKDPAGPGAPPDVVARKFPDPRKVWTLNHGFPSGLAGRPLFTVGKGNVVVLALTNRSSWTQVIRVHGHVFRVLHGLDDGWEPYFMDTVIVGEGRTVRIAFNADNPGKWLIRSTILEHMESGVLSWFEVLG